MLKFGVDPVTWGYLSFWPCTCVLGVLVHLLIQVWLLPFGV